MKILFIAYYFDPFPGVGSKRVSYWANNIANIFRSEKSYSATIITATEQNVNIPTLPVHFVKDTGRSKLRQYFRTDKGASWYADLYCFLRAHLKENHYDVALITGGPFLHFFVISMLKRYGIKVLLDFRDPFATNPRATNYRFSFYIKSLALKAMEAYFVLKADRIITVNKYCASLIFGYKHLKKKFYIIDNGFDERQLPVSNLPKQRGNFLTYVYAGNLYKDRNPTTFLKLLVKRENTIFKHIGPESPFLASYQENQSVIEYGVRSYSETISIVAESDICLIFTSGHPFESTTKIFDYIGLNKFILIVTEGTIKDGGLHQITKNYPNVLWSKNTEKDIEATLDLLDNSFQIKEFEEKNQFSRNSGLIKLIDCLDKL